MHEHVALLLSVLLLLIYGLISKVAEKSPITAPMVFLGTGLLFSTFGFNLTQVHIETNVLKLLAELTLVIILFVDASLIRFNHLINVLRGIPARLLGIGMPLTMLCGWCVGVLLFPNWSYWSITLVALILAPTDAALGQAVVKSPHVPQNIRDGISVESGLNDGLALPVILICIAALSSDAAVFQGDGHWFSYIALQLTLGPIIGALVGYVGGKLIEFASQRDWMEPVFQSLSALSLSILAFAFAEILHGNGFIAAFFAGLMLGVKKPQVRERIQEFGEAQGQFLSLTIFLVVGLVAVPLFAEYWTWKVWLYAFLSLTVIRMLPVLLGLKGLKVNTYSKLFIGWFGPRGIASLLYVLIVIAELGLQNYQGQLSVIILTVTLSTFLHGISAIPLSLKFKRYDA
ncbi:cation:proton antiporter [Shewanella gelidii]|uniref:Sodium:proton antiporter n=1 Tax=Shewanella gelidii TaxID=1642821 RepID=A0A917ND46_9GAMM|nr:cation:proton antiporter [Shewanella gelidii]MCL1098178.1 cation:proton antiporter [Shewanella gelidii]GGI91160.1 sodium:proton antiporter [Shewanella gelidii]